MKIGKLAGLLVLLAVNPAHASSLEAASELEQFMNGSEYPFNVGQVKNSDGTYTTYINQLDVTATVILSPKMVPVSGVAAGADGSKGSIITNPDGSVSLKAYDANSVLSYQNTTTFDSNTGLPVSGSWTDNVVGQTGTLSSGAAGITYTTEDGSGQVIDQYVLNVRTNADGTVTVDDLSTQPTAIANNQIWITYDPRGHELVNSGKIGAAYYVNIENPGGVEISIRYDASGNAVSLTGMKDGATVDNLTSGIQPIVEGASQTAPAGLTATLSGSSQIDLAWTASPGAAFYAVYGGGGGAPLVITSANSFSFGGLPAGASYGFKVAACDIAYHCSDQSAEVSATTGTGVLQAPTGLTAFPDQGLLNLSWGGVSGAASYNVFANGSPVPIYSGSITGFDSTMLISGETYSLTVAACDASNSCSSQSSPISATVPVPSPAPAIPTPAVPATPSGLTATTISAFRITLTWQPNGAASYGIFVNGGSAPAFMVKASQFTIGGFQPGKTYSFTVEACNSNYGCSAQSAPVQATTLNAFINIVQGWNLAGDGMSDPIAASSAFGDPSKVVSVWKWEVQGSNQNITYPAWAFYSPLLSDGGAAYAASHGYDFLATINPGEGFWVNSKQEFVVPLSGSTVPSASFADSAFAGEPNSLPKGWSLIAIGDNSTASGFNNVIGALPPQPQQIASNVLSIWAWNAELNNWYFYAPSLDSQGGAALADYIATKHYLGFGNMRLGPGTGFWVNHP